MKKTRIEFESIDVAMPDLDWECVRDWIVEVAATYGCSVRRLLYVFMDDAGILKANIEALGHDYYTDIITFDYTRGTELSGEMEISRDIRTTLRARAAASNNSWSASSYRHQ